MNTQTLTDVLNRYRAQLAKDPNAVVEVVMNGDVNTSDTQVEGAIASLLPVVIAALSPIIAARKITIATATAAITAISSVVMTGAPQLKGASARAVVIALFSWSFDTYLAKLLPIWARPFAGAIKSAAVGALEVAYQTVVRPKLAK